MSRHSNPQVVRDAVSNLVGPAPEPWMTHRTCTDPDCNDSCGGNRDHPAARPADEETIGCG